MNILRIASLAIAGALFLSPARADAPFVVADYTPVSVTLRMKVTKFSAAHVAHRKVIRHRSAKKAKRHIAPRSSIVRPVQIGGVKVQPFCTAEPIRFEALSRVVTWPMEQLVRPFVRPAKMTEPMEPWQIGLIDQREDTIQYLVRTATPGGTMIRQGPRVAIERLDPEFATRLGKAIREARANGLPSAGIYSAYRPAGFGVGGFKDKFRSNHNIGHAVDMAGIGRPGSKEALIWFRIAGRNGIFMPYGPYHRKEWNHAQPQMMLAVAPGSAIRKTVDKNGPLATPGMRIVLAGGSYVAVQSGLANMWEVGSSLIRNAVWTGPPPQARRRLARRHHVRPVYARHHRVRMARAS